MFIPFTNWFPDADPVAPNLLVDPSKNMVPTDRGYKGANSFLSVNGQTSLSGTAVGMWFARRTDGNNQMYGGTPTNIYLRSGGTWSAHVAAAVTVSAVSRWQFAQWGNLTFAGALETQPLVSDTTTFTSIAAMPRYAIIDSVNEFLMIGNVSVSVTYSDGFGSVMVTPGDYQDRWWCSGVGNPLTWQPNNATQAASGRLTDVSGKLTAGRALGDRFAFYKQRGIYLGEYTSVPFIWSWSLISSEIGTFGQQCVVPVGEFHYFIGNDDIYVFDGQQARSIGFGIRRWFFNVLDKSYAYLIWGVYDQYNKLIYWWYPSVTSTNGVLDAFIVYHLPSGKWGRGVLTMRAASSFFVDALTWDQLWTGYAFDTIPNTTFDAAVYQAESFVPIFFDSSSKLATLDGPQLNSILATTFGGDDTRTSLLRRIRARWITTPTTAQLTPFRLMRQGETQQPGNPQQMYNARWDFTQNARWHRIQIDTTGNWETSGIDAEVYTRGRE